MHQFLGDRWAYGLINYTGFVVMMISSLLYYKSKRNVIGLYSKHIIHRASCVNIHLGKGVKFIFASIESLIMALIVDLSSYVNRPFGDLVGTGANYFGLLYLVPIAWLVVSSILLINPLKQADITTLCLPVYLFFGKTACFFQGCCWGIPWEYGPYNHHPDHPGNQVPVQAIEAFWAVLIFIFLLCYRKKAKTGTMYPMYIILYSATRFCSEFFRREENVVWIFKTYHLLCIIGFVVGFILFFVIRKYGEKLSDFFDKPHIKFEQTVAEYEENKLKEQMKNKTKAQADETKRLENIRLARERAKARKK